MHSVYFELGKIFALKEAGLTKKSQYSYEVQKPISKETNEFENKDKENILPALSLGGSTPNGVDRLYESTLT